MKQLSLLGNEDKNIVVFDIETQKGFSDTKNITDMGVAAAILYSYKDNEYKTYTEQNVQELIDELQNADVVVGYNHISFDFKVLEGYTDKSFTHLNSIDMMRHTQKELGFRPKLDNLAGATLGVNKSADGLQSLEWWKQGKLDEIIKYCTQDVKVTKELYEFGRDNGYIYFDGFNGKKKLEINW